MKQHADIVAFDRHGQIALTIEVKNKRGTSTEWASRLRQNMYAHGITPHTPFYLLALPDRFYLWKNPEKTASIVDPIVEVDPRPFLQRFYSDLLVSPESQNGKTFEYVIAAWLNQVLSAKSPQELSGEDHDWLASSGLFEKIAGGRLELDAAA